MLSAQDRALDRGGHALFRDPVAEYPVNGHPSVG